MNPVIANRIQQLRAEIARAEREAGRAPGSVALMAVSKRHSAEQIRAAAVAGITDIGESYLQEALPKQQQLTDLALNWHFIGPIQTNKTRAIAAHFDWVHSVDRLKVAQRLSAQRDPRHPLNICLQVNISDEASKSGIALPELAALASAVIGLPGLNLRGLMAIPAPRDDYAQQRADFALLRAALDQLRAQHPAQRAQLDTLSMGMSDDLRAAIVEGSTMVRIGSAIFGAR